MKSISKSKKPRQTIYYNHKQLYDEYMNMRAVCQCGCIVLKSNLKGHLKSKKHAKLMAIQEKINADAKQ